MDDPLVARMRGFGETIFAEMSALATRTGAINLGQGFPDSDGPREVLDAAAAAILAGHNQYPPGPGLPELRRAVAAHQERFRGLRVDPETQVLVTVGATEGIAASVLALVEPGDEVVVFEPYYDSYAATVALAGGVRRTVPLRFPDFAVDEAELRAAFSERTRLVLLNTPHNPTGKVFTREELETICALAREHDAWVLVDEVYEHLVFDDARHVSVASLPGMAERTLSVSSAGKTFSVTGWKVGWITGPAEAVRAAMRVKQFLTYGVGAPLQVAVATALGLDDAVFAGLASDLAERRDLLCEGLDAAGLPYARPAGTYFVVTDLAPLGVRDAAAFAREMPERCGVVGIPVSAFHDDRDVAASLMRFAFCKQADVLAEGAARLARLSR